MFYTGHLIARWEGALFFGYYCAYMTYLILSAIVPEVSRTFDATILLFVTPLTVLTLGIALFRAWRSPIVKA